MENSKQTVECKGKQIPAWFNDKEGKRWSFDRPAMEDKHGGIPLSQLRDHECVKAPGAIYRQAPHI